MKKSAKLFIATGCLCVCIALGLFLKMQIENILIERQNKFVTNLLNDYLMNLKDTNDNPSLDNQTVYIDGNLYMGLLRIESINMELPVHYEWTNKNLKDSPCYYQGLLGEDNLIIGAHRTPVHFGALDKLEIGDKVEFIDPSGHIHHYVVSKSYIVHESEVEELKNTSGSDLTLFTCYSDNSYRRIIRCVRDDKYSTTITT